MYACICKIWKVKSSWLLSVILQHLLFFEDDINDEFLCNSLQSLAHDDQAMAHKNEFANIFQSIKCS